jgi:hypothetical protein
MKSNGNWKTYRNCQSSLKNIFEKINEDIVQKTLGWSCEY